MKLLLILVAVGALLGCDHPAVPKATPTQAEKTTPTKKNPLRSYQLDELGKVDLNVNGKKVEAWLMDDNGKITEGMMYLQDKDVRDDQGMLFVFGTNEPRSFWMANCPLGLDIAFMSPEGKIVKIQQGKPFDETSLPSGAPAKYVLEMKVGSLEKLGVKAGDRIQIPEGLNHKE